MKQILRLTTTLIVLMFLGGNVWGQTYLIQEGFTTTSLPTGWSGDVYFNTSANIGNLTGANGAGFNANKKYLELPALNNVGTLTFWMKGSAATSQISIKVQKSVGGGAFTDIATFPKPHSATAVKQTVSVNDASNNIVLKFEAYDRTGNSIYLDDVEVTQNSASPTITVSPSTLSSFTYVLGSGPSAEQTFTVGGSNLTNDISIAAPTNYEISLAAGSGYTSLITLTQTSGAVATTTIYVRLKSGLPVGTYNDETITATSTGATNKTVTCSGSVTAAPAPDAPVATAATSVGQNGFAANWNAVSGATGYNLDVYTKTGGNFAPDLFISEYGEGSSNNKYIEIFNGTGSTVDLSDYTLKQSYNGGGWSGDPNSSYNLPLSGNLANNEVFVIANSGANSAILAQADMAIDYNSSVQGGTVVSFTGNDAMGLFKNEVLIDVFGDPSSNLTIPVAGFTSYGMDHTIVRKSSVTSGNTDWVSSSGTNITDSEWIGYAQDTWTYIGSHTMDGASSITYASGYENLDVANVTSYAVIGLAAATDYYYVVRAYNASGTSASSNEIEVTTTGGNQNPVITNIVTNPASGFTSSTIVSVSADVTDSDGTVEGVELHWGTTSGSLGTTISMTNTSGDTFKTVTDIPAQSNGVTVYYEIYAIDDDADDATSPEQSYTVTDPVVEPTNHPTGFEAVASSSSAIIVGWNDAVPAAAGYLIKGSTTSYEDIVPPVDGTPESDALLVQNFAADEEIFEFTGLTASTQYFFKIYPYNGSGAEINYKTDGNVPETTATTEAAVVFDNVETFDNFDATGTSYLTGTFLGQDGSTWTYTEARGDFAITGKALMIGRNRTPQSEVYSGTIGGGIQVLNFDYMQAYTNDVNLSVLVNDVVVGNVTSSVEEGVVKNSGDITVNVTGNFVLKFKNVNNSNGQVVIDNISWNSISAFSAYNGTGNWSETANWSKGLPTGTTDVIINGNVTVDDVVECNNMTISPTGAVTVGAAQGLIVNSDLLIESNASGTGSFIGDAADYVITGTTTAQRYLSGGWSDWDAGWHQISSPVASQPIVDFVTAGAGNGYDFYGWDEPTNMWMNYKAAGFEAWNDNSANFNVGQGYLVSYESQNITQTFTGELNSDDVTLENISKGGNGWHLLGNPYASALVWNDENNWILDNVAGNAKIWHETNKSYSDIAPNGIIPSAQGFMVQVSDAANGILFYATARTHDTQPFYKAGNEQLLLVAAETEGGSAQESKIIINSMATEGFDFEYDSRFLAGYAPMLYSVVGDEMLSTNSLPELTSGKVIPFGFVKNAATNFTIELKESIPGTVVYLTDFKTGLVQNLTQNSVYNFTAAEGDDPARFDLKFGAVGIGDTPTVEATTIYSHGQSLYISSTQSADAQVSVYNVTGQQVYGNRMMLDGQKQITLNVITGWYIVKVSTQEGIATQKVFIKAN